MKKYKVTDSSGSEHTVIADEVKVSNGAVFLLVKKCVVGYFPCPISIVEKTESIGQ